MYFITTIETINAEHFWKREKIWREKYEADVVKGVVEVINKKRRKYGLL